MRVVVAANQELIRESLVELLSHSFATVGQELDPAPGYTAQGEVVLGVLGGGDVQSSIRRLQANYPAARLLVFLLSDDFTAAVDALQCGVQGIVDQSATTAELIQCLQQAAAGEFAISRQLASRLARLHAFPAPVSRDADPFGPSQLTPRETEVLRLLSEGRTNREIAGRLSLSEHTVRAHLRGIMQKLHVSNRVQAAAVAWQGQSSKESFVSQGGRKWQS
jgi:DNA-binding NarL/FixJ family response regulator